MLYTNFMVRFIPHIPALSIIILTFAVFILTKNPLTGPFKLQMALLSIMALIIFMLYARKKERGITESRTLIYLLLAATLFLVGATGWFFSPFFFSLYLLTIILAFILGPPASIGFVGTLVCVFAFNIGEVDPVYDFLVVASLITSIPISFYLRREYLRLREAQKDILVLKEEKKYYQSKVEEILANKINNLAVSLRQPATDIKLLAMRLNKQKSKEDLETNTKRIVTSAQEALRILEEFEESATGKKFLSTPKTA